MNLYQLAIIGLLLLLALDLIADRGRAGSRAFTLTTLAALVIFILLLWRMGRLG